MVWRNLTTTLELGRIKTWRLPAFSALLMLLRASWRTEVRTIFAVVVGGDSQFDQVDSKGGIWKTEDKKSALATDGREHGEYPRGWGSSRSVPRRRCVSGPVNGLASAGLTYLGSRDPRQAGPPGCSREQETPGWAFLIALLRHRESQRGPPGGKLKSRAYSLCEFCRYFTYLEWLMVVGGVGG
jgi:hypothetical protein